MSAVFLKFQDDIKASFVGFLEKWRDMPMYVATITQPGERPSFLGEFVHKINAGIGYMSSDPEEMREFLTEWKDAQHPVGMDELPLYALALECARQDILIGWAGTPAVISSEIISALAFNAVAHNANGERILVIWNVAVRDPELIEVLRGPSGADNIKGQIWRVQALDEQDELLPPERYWLVVGDEYDSPVLARHCASHTVELVTRSSLNPQLAHLADTWHQTHIVPLQNDVEPLSEEIEFMSREIQSLLEDVKSSSDSIESRLNSIRSELDMLTTEALTEQAPSAEIASDTPEPDRPAQTPSIPVQSDQAIQVTSDTAEPDQTPPMAHATAKPDQMTPTAHETAKPASSIHYLWYFAIGLAVGAVFALA